MRQKEERGSHSITKPHDASRRDRAKEAGHEPPDAGLLGGRGEGYLIPESLVVERRDEDVDARQELDELILGSLEVHPDDLDASVLEGLGFGFVLG